MRSLIAATACAVTIALLPASAIADDAARISYLESEIRKLRTQLGEQDRRIQRLEAELERRGGEVPPDWKTSRPTVLTATKIPRTSDPLPPHSPDAWDRVTKGMTQEEVVQILGEPSAVEAVDNLKSLLYREATADGGSVSGHVNLKDDRVVAVKKPTARQ